MEHSLVCVGIIITLCVITGLVFFVVWLHNKNRKHRLNKYTVKMHQIGYDETYEYILREIEATNPSQASEIAKDTIAKCGYFGILSAQEKYDEISKLLIVDSVEQE